MKIALAILITVMASQIIKGVIQSIQTGFSIKNFLGDGGFPSTHSGLVSCLTLSIFFEQGFSVLFFASIVFSIIVINDSFRVRKETGDHAKILNKIIIKENLSFPKMFEREGHTKGQVVAGIIFGIIITLIIYTVL